MAGGSPTSVGRNLRADVSANRRRDPIAIVGIGAHSVVRWQWRLSSTGSWAARADCEPTAPRRGWHVGRIDAALDRLRGFYLDSFRLRADRFRIPPRELEEMLPQQSLMLKVAAEAIEDCRLGTRPGPADGRPDRPGTRPEHEQLPAPLVARRPGRRWNRAEARPLRTRSWTPGSTSCARRPALRCRRTGRWARWAGWSPAGSPGSSGSAARASRSRATRRRELRPCRSRRTGSGRESSTRRSSARWTWPGTCEPSLASSPRLGEVAPGEGAAAFVLKRLDDALRDGDRVYAMIRGTSAVTGRPERSRRGVRRPSRRFRPLECAATGSVDSRDRPARGGRRPGLGHPGGALPLSPDPPCVRSRLRSRRRNPGCGTARRARAGPP